jgi:hypothetical protein
MNKDLKKKTCSAADAATLNKLLGYILFRTAPRTKTPVSEFSQRNYFFSWNYVSQRSYCWKWNMMWEKVHAILREKRFFLSLGAILESPAMPRITRVKVRIFKTTWQDAISGDESCPKAGIVPAPGSLICRTLYALAKWVYSNKCSPN